MPTIHTQIDDIERMMLKGKLAPAQVAEMRVVLSALYSRVSALLEDILVTKPQKWIEMRKECASDKACDRQFEATEHGIQEMRLKLTLKRIEKLLSALRTLLELMTQEANNSY